MLEKFKSRKFLMATLSVIVGIMGMFGVADNTIEMVSSIALILIPIITYIITEGKIDAAAVNQVVSSIDDIIDILMGINDDDESEIDDDKTV